MAIKIYKFSYEVTSSAGRILPTDYLSTVKNLIRDKTGNLSFEFPRYFRCSINYILPFQVIPDGSILQWWTHYKKYIGKEYAGRGDYYILSPNYKRYTYNKRNIPLEYPETQLTDKLGFEEFHAVEQWFTILLYNQNNNTRHVIDDQIVRCEVTVTYSDDELIAGDEKPKKYLANLDFGNRRSRRNNKNRRKYRNRY